MTTAEHRLTELEFRLVVMTDQLLADDVSRTHKNRLFALVWVVSVGLTFPLLDSPEERIIAIACVSVLASIVLLVNHIRDSEYRKRLVTDIDNLSAVIELTNEIQEDSPPVNR